MKMQMEQFRKKLKKIIKKLKKPNVTDESAISNLAKTLKTLTKIRLNLQGQLKGLIGPVASKKRPLLLAIRAVYTTERQIREIFAAFLLICVNKRV